MAYPSASARSSGPDRRRRLSDRAILHLFIWPTLILLIAMNVFPLFYSLYLGFTNYSAIANQAPVWVGFGNFSEILNDEQLWKYFATTGRYALASGSLQTICPNWACPCRMESK
jgi:multiple sugar transport system permease protein